MRFAFLVSRFAFSRIYIKPERETRNAKRETYPFYDAPDQAEEIDEGG